jgi:hypothetical protein
MKHLLISLVIGVMVGAGVYLALAVPLYQQLATPIPHPGLGLHHHHGESVSPDSAFAITLPFGVAAFLASTMVIWLIQSFIFRKPNSTDSSP